MSRDVQYVLRTRTQSSPESRAPDQQDFNRTVAAEEKLTSGVQATALQRTPGPGDRRGGERRHYTATVIMAILAVPVKSERFARDRPVRVVFYIDRVIA